MVFSRHWIDISSEKSYGWVEWGGDGVGWWLVGLQCQPQSQALSSGLWILDFGLGFWTWILALDLELDLVFRTWIWDLDLGLDLGLTIIYLNTKNVTLKFKV